jgi:hypothetical protein
MNGATRTKLLEWTLFFGLVACAVTLNVLWQIHHPEPIIPAFDNLSEFFSQWDEFTAAPFEHLSQVLRNYDRGGHRSLMYLTTGVTILALGFNRFGILLISTVFLVILMAGVFGTVRRLRPGAGALAAVIVVLSPAAVFWSRVYSPFIAVMATSALGVYLLVRSEKLTRLAPTLAFGLLAAMALRLPVEVGDALQIELTFACTGVFVFLLAMFRPDGGRLRPILLSVAAFVVFAVTVNKPCLWHSLQYAYQEAVLLAPTKYAPGSVVDDPVAALTHVGLLWQHHLGPFLCVVTALAILVIAWRPRAEDGWGFAFFVAPLVIATLVNKKAFYYSFGFLPGAAVVVGLAVGRFKNKGVVAACLAVLLSGLIFTNPWAMDSPRVTPSQSPAGEEWYEQYMEFGTNSQARRSPDESVVAGLVDAVSEVAGPSQEVKLLYLGTLDSVNQSTAFRFSLRIAAENPHFFLADPIRDLGNMRGKGAIAPQGVNVPETPNVIFLNVPDGRAFSPDALVEPATWRTWFQLDSGCGDFNLDGSATCSEITNTLVDFFVTLPWDAYRLRLGAPGTRVLLFDRPDLGVDIQLPGQTAPQK